MSTYLTYDLGTTGVKVALFGRDLTALGSAYRQYPRHQPLPGHVEQRPADWWEAARAATTQLLAATGADPAQIAGISFSGQMMGQIPIGADHALLQDSVAIWEDARAGAQAEGLLEKLGGYQAFYDIVLQGMAPELYSLPRILWLRENAPALFERTRWFLHAKDYLGLRFTGEISTDFSDLATSVVMDLRKRSLSPEILQASGLDAALFPEPHETIERLGSLRPAIASEFGLAAGTPVFVGSGDAPAAAAGAFALEPGDAYFYIGSAAWGGTIESQPLGDSTTRVNVLPHIVPGLYHAQYVMNTGGIAQQWAVETFYGSQDYARAIADATAVRPKDSTALFLPFLRGGGAPHNNMNARGEFLGLGLEHGRGHLIRAVLEGLAYNIRSLVQKLEGRRGSRLAAVTLVGGGAQNALWMQIVADVLQRPVRVNTLKQEGNCFAAALNVAVGLGHMSRHADAKALAQIDRSFEPDAALAGFYDAKHHLFEQAFAAAQPGLAGLAALRGAR